MRAPELVLPSNSMKWGRFIAETEASTSAAIEAQKEDINSVGSKFKARADNLSSQIKGIQNVANIVVTPVASFSRSYTTGSFPSPALILLSPVIVINAPTQAPASRVQVILNFKATHVSGTGNLQISVPMMNVNGVLASDPMVEAVATGGTPGLVGTYSVTNSLAVAPGGALSIQFGLRMNPYYNGTVDFTDITIWSAFYGSL